MTNKAKVQAVIDRIANGESENGACEAEGISRNTFRSAALKHLAADDYARALGLLAHDQVEKLEKTIADMRDGTIDAAMARVEIEARKWFASKFLPRQYGDKTAVEHSGELGLTGLADTLQKARERAKDTG